MSILRTVNPQKVVFLCWRSLEGKDPQSQSVLLIRLACQDPWAQDPWAIEASYTFLSTIMNLTGVELSFKRCSGLPETGSTFLRDR
jgi:hypothetical protein